MNDTERDSIFLTAKSIQLLVYSVLLFSKPRVLAARVLSQLLLIEHCDKGNELLMVQSEISVDISLLSGLSCYFLCQIHILGVRMSAMPIQSKM